MPKDPFDKAIRLLSIGQAIIVTVFMFLVIRNGVIEGQRTGTIAGLISSLLPSIGIAGAIALMSLAINKGFQWLERLSEWLEDKFMLYPVIRRWIIAVSVSSAPLLVYWGVSRMQSSFIAKALVVLWFGLALPAAIISLIRADKLKEKSPLIKYISRESFAHDSQAAVAKAFTVVEQRLKEKIGIHETANYGYQLINEAYGGDHSKLMIFINGEDKTSQLRDFLCGAYTLLRNPRHHSLIEDDEYTADAIYSVAGLLLNFIDASEKRVKVDAPEK